MTKTYSRVHQLLHWSTFVLFLVQLWTYPAIERTHVDHPGMAVDPWDLQLHKIHMISGGIILVFALMRLWLRKKYPVKPVLFSHSQLERLAQYAHFGLYAVLVLLPVTGFLKSYIISAAGPVHVILARLLYALLILHVVGVLVHVVVWRDGLLARMGVHLPFQRSRIKTGHSGED